MNTQQKNEVPETESKIKERFYANQILNNKHYNKMVDKYMYYNYNELIIILKDYHDDNAVVEDDNDD